MFRCLLTVSDTSSYMPFLLSTLPDEEAYSYIVEVPKQKDQDADWVMYVGETYKLPLTSTGMFKWESSDKTVASIDEKGLLTGNGEGDTILTVTVPGGKQAVIKLHISNL